MALDIYEFYPNLEPNHTIVVTGDVQIVLCPFKDESGQFFQTPWSLSASPEEVNCLFCEYLNGAENLSGPTVPCDENPPIAGGAHGGTHQALEYARCQVPLRRISAFNISLVVHEGIVGDCAEADKAWRRQGGAAWFTIRQEDTGSYNCRNSEGHSRAVAIDFNWKDNAYRKPRPASGCPQQPQMRDFYERCWKPLGYGWGGLWRSACDAMHISKLKSEGGNGVLYSRQVLPVPPAPQPAPPPPSTGGEDMFTFEYDNRIYLVMAHVKRHIGPSEWGMHQSNGVPHMGKVDKGYADTFPDWTVLGHNQNWHGHTHGALGRIENTLKELRTKLDTHIAHSGGEHIHTTGGPEQE